MVDRIVWTEDRIEKLKELWRHRSASEIVAIFAEEGVHISRSAVVGKVFRLGLTVEGKIIVRPQTRENGHKRPRVERGVGGGSVGSIAFGIIHKIKAIQKGRDAPDVLLDIRADTVAEPKHIGLLDLTPFSCRAIYGEGVGATYCGHMTATVHGHGEDRRSPYCAAHHRLYYKPAPAKQKPWSDARKRAA